MIEEIQQQVQSLQPGATLKVSGHFLRESVQPREYNGFLWEPQDVVMTGIIGGAYQYGYSYLKAEDVFCFFRLEDRASNGEMAYLEPDRRTGYKYNGRTYSPAL